MNILQLLIQVLILSLCLTELVSQLDYSFHLILLILFQAIQIALGVLIILSHLFKLSLKIRNLILLVLLVILAAFNLLL